MTLPTNTTTTPTTLQTQIDFILLDGSGSMTDKWWPTLDAIDAYVMALQQQDINSHILMSVFDSYQIETLTRDCPINDYIPQSSDPAGSSWGTTPLYDAINLMARRLRDLDPPRCAITIFTDGDENASKSTTLTQAKALLDWMRAKGWQITFVGCDFNNQRQSALLGSSRQQAIGVQTALLSDATKALAAKRARYALYGDNMHFSESEQQQFGGYLASSPHSATETQTSDRSRSEPSA